MHSCLLAPHKAFSLLAFFFSPTQRKRETQKEKEGVKEFTQGRPVISPKTAIALALHRISSKKCTFLLFLVLPPPPKKKTKSARFSFFLLAPFFPYTSTTQWGFFALFARPSLPPSNTKRLDKSPPAVLEEKRSLGLLRRVYFSNVSVPVEETA